VLNCVFIEHVLITPNAEDCQRRDQPAEAAIAGTGAGKALFFRFHARHASERFLAQTLAPHSVQPRTQVLLGNSTASNSTAQPGWFVTGGCSKVSCARKLLITTGVPSFLAQNPGGNPNRHSPFCAWQYANANRKTAARTQNPDSGGSENTSALAMHSQFAGGGHGMENAVHILN